MLVNPGFPPCNFGATVAPGPTDDSSKGYDVGSMWVDTSAKVAYVATSVAVGAAQWNPVPMTSATAWAPDLFLSARW